MPQLFVSELLQPIENQMTELREIVERVSQDRNFETADERLSRWKSRTVRLLSEKINSNEGDKLEDKHLTSWSTYDQLKNIQDKADMWGGFLQSLREELEKHPEDILAIPIPLGEAVRSTQILSYYSSPKPSSSTYLAE